MLHGSKSKQNFVEGSAILLSATVLVKILGAVFKIPLNNMLGELGVGYFTTAYDLYSPLYSLATAGIPVAISKMISSSVERKNYKDVSEILKISKKLFFVVGIVGTVVLALLAYPFVVLTGNGDINTLLPVLSIAPGFAVCSVISVYRGYYEGLHNMRPTAVSNIFEGIGKLVLGLTLSYLVLTLRGDRTMKTLSISAAAAMGGIVLSSAVACFYLYLKYKNNSQLFSKEELELSNEPTETKIILKTLCYIAVPVVICSLLTNITSLIDVITVKNQLKAAIKTNPDIFVEMYGELIEKNLVADSSFTIWDLPTALYGCHRSYAYSIYNLVPMLTASLGVGLIPVLSAAWVRNNKQEIKQNLETMLKFSALISMPAGMGICVLAKPILNLLYSSNPVAVEIASKNLSLLGICAIFSGMTVPMLSILQAIGKQKVPLYNILIGSIIKIILNFVLVSNPNLNILGVPIGTTVCYLYIFVSNCVCLIKYSGVKLNFHKTLVKPLIASLICAISAGVVYYLGNKIIVSNKILTVVSICFSVLIYILSVYFLNILDKNDKFFCVKGKK